MLFYPHCLRFCESSKLLLYCRKLLQKLLQAVCSKIVFPDLFKDLLHLFESAHCKWTLTNTLVSVPDSELNQGARFSEIEVQFF